MTTKGIENVNPQRFVKKTKREVTIEEEDESVKDPIDEREIFDLLRDISDPEHPMSLEELNVVQITNIEVDDHKNSVKVFYTPTIPHCSMATLIGLSIKVCLLRSLPPRFKVEVNISPGSHASEEAVNKQLADKERVSAALENSNLLEVVNQCIVKSLE
ncbi:MIP18 family protein galla-2-like [Daphnia carinata]|uniref:MIP18 family protein galla-2-like n=1 Tax=Daphnia carinata TaxID=120202 RepID=UPI00257D8869|nr:MIP18 family protein galla-2-like [Daphnia carinata]